MHKPNHLLEVDVRGEFGWDPLLDSTRIVVHADDGKVTLSGVVPTYYETVLADQDAARVGGVIMVDNQLLVGSLGEAAVDKTIATSCTTALHKDRFVPHGSVSVTVRAGRVTLRGEVRHHLQRRAAEHAVRQVDGVLGLTDRISLTSGPIPSDVVNRIRRAFERNAIVDESLIEVASKGHTIYLDGTVSDRFAMDEAVGRAYLAPGVREVISRLIIVP